MSWIKLHRQFLEWEWFDSSDMVKVFLYLLLSANFEDRKWHGAVVRRGQLLTSWENLSEATGISVQSLRTCMKKLESTGEISRKSTNRNTIITVCNYDRYQVAEEGDQQATNKQLTSDQQATNNNIRNKEIYNISLQETQAHTRAREDWRHLSSVRKQHLGFDKDRIAEYKKELLRQQVSELSGEVGMNPQQTDAFVRWWGEHSPGSDTLKAEYETVFDVKARMQAWVERERPRGARNEQQTKSRMDRFEEDMNFINDFFNGRRDTVDEQ